MGDESVTPSVTPGPSLFDLNHDLYVDAEDLLLLRTCADSGDPAADFNQDGGVDAADILLFARYWEGAAN